MTIRKCTFQQETALLDSGYDVEGVCLELTRRWVKARLTGQWKEDSTIYEWTDRAEISGVLKAQNERGKRRDVGVEGLSHMLGASRTGGEGCCSKFTGLRTRMDVINHVLSVPGVYIYMASPTSGGGHAFSFDTCDPSRIVVFDPNQGEFILTDESAASVRAWWKCFWDASGTKNTDGTRNYKRHYHQGARELYKFLIAPD